MLRGKQILGLVREFPAANDSHNLVMSTLLELRPKDLCEDLRLPQNFVRDRMMEVTLDTTGKVTDTMNNIGSVEVTWPSLLDGLACDCATKRGRERCRRWYW
jgi:hypothetical protein